jgi:16S rRNA (guanine527-N7)-methyltransferase
VTTLDGLTHAFGLDRDQAAALGRYLELLMTWRAGNVTAVRSREEAVDRLLADSLALLDVPALAVAGTRWLDLGAGAGIPGIPVAVARRDARLTLLESAAKKCVFLREAVATTSLTERAVVVHARSEEYAARETEPSGREAYDVVFARAVSGLATVVELAAPLLAVGGVLLAVKSAEGAARELPAAEVAAGRCGLVVKATVALPRSPLRDSVCVVVGKRDAAPDWLPRRPGLAARRPLGS